MKKILGLLIIFIVFFTVNVEAASDKIILKGITISAKSDTITVEEPTVENNTINSSIKFNKVSDYVTYEVTLENKDDYDYTIDSIVDNKDNTNLKLEYNYEEKIEKGKTHKIQIKLSYDSEVEGIEDISLSDLVIKLNLTRSDGVKEQVGITNPETSDNIINYVVLLFISMIGIVLLTKKYKVGKLFVILPLLFIPIMVSAKEKLELNITFKNIEIITEKPKVVYYKVDNEPFIDVEQEYDEETEEFQFVQKINTELAKEESEASWIAYIKETTYKNNKSYMGCGTLNNGNSFCIKPNDYENTKTILTETFGDKCQTKGSDSNEWLKCEDDMTIVSSNERYRIEVTANSENVAQNPGRIELAIRYEFPQNLTLYGEIHSYYMENNEIYYGLSTWQEI